MSELPNQGTGHWVKSEREGGGREGERERERCVCVCVGGGGGGAIQQASCLCIYTGCIAMGSTMQVHVHVHPQCKTNTIQLCAVQRVGIVLHSVFNHYNCPSLGIKYSTWSTIN